MNVKRINEPSIITPENVELYFIGLKDILNHFEKCQVITLQNKDKTAMVYSIVLTPKDKKAKYTRLKSIFTDKRTAVLFCKNFKKFIHS